MTEQQQQWTFRKRNRPLVLSTFESHFRTWTVEPDRWDSNLPPPTHPVILGKLPLGFSFLICVCVWGGHVPRHTRTCVLSCVQLFSTPWTVARQAPLCPWDFPSQNTGVGCHVFLQGIFPTQGLNPCLLHCMWIHHTAPPWEALPHL